MDYRYDAFISYRHMEPDAAIAKKLARALETYSIPRYIKKASGKKRMGKVFRDQDELPTSGSLSENINAALRDSEWLVVVCSPDLVNSKWCMKEVDTFIELGRRDRILTMLTRGEPNESFPPQLCYMQDADGNRQDVEPLAADIRAENFGGMSKKLKTEKLRLLAPILGVGYDDLKRRARERRLRLIAAAAAGVALVVGAFGLYALDRARTIAAANVVIAGQRDEALLAQSKFVTALAWDAYNAGNREVAAIAATRILPKSLTEPERPIYANAIGLLRTMEMHKGLSEYAVTHVYPYTAYGMELALDGTVDVWPENEDVLRSAARQANPETDYVFSPDGKIAAEWVVYIPEDPALKPPDYLAQYNEIWIYDYETKTLLSTIRPFSSTGKGRILMSGRRAATFGTGGVVVWDVDTGERVLTVFTRQDLSYDEMEAIASPGITSVSDAATSGRMEKVRNFYLCGDGEILVMETRNAQTECLVRAYEVKTGNVLWEIPGCYIWRVSPDRTVFSAYMENERGYESLDNPPSPVMIYSAKDGRLLLTLETPDIREIEFGGKENDAFVFAQGKLTRYSLYDGTVREVVELPDCNKLIVSADGDTILSASYSRNSSYNYYLIERQHPGLTRKIDYVGGTKSGDGRLIFLFTIGFEAIDIYKNERFEKIGTLTMKPSEDGLPAYDLPISSYDGSRLFYRGHVYDTATNDILCRVPLGTELKHKQEVLGFSADNTRLVTYAHTDHESQSVAADRCEIRCYDAATGEYMFSYGEDLISVYGLTIAGDRLMFQEGIEREGERFYNLYTGELIREIAFPSADYGCEAFSPDYSLMALVDDTNPLSYHVIICDTLTGQEVGQATIPHLYAASNPILMFRDNHSYYAISTDSVIEVDIKSGETIRTVIEASADTDLRVSAFDKVSEDRNWFIGRNGEIWRLSDGALYAKVPRLGLSNCEIYGNYRIIDYRWAPHIWHVKTADSETHPAVPLEMYVLRTDQEVLDAAIQDYGEMALFWEEEERFFLN